MSTISFNIYGIKLNEGHCSLGTVIIHFSDKPYQEINFKSHLIVHYFVNMEKYCQICTCPGIFYFSLLVCAYFCNEIEKCHLKNALKYFIILQLMKNDFQILI